MIVLLCADEQDAQRFRALTNTDQAVLAMSGADVPDGIAAGARVLRSNRWAHNERAIDALRALAERVPLVDPTGLLGNVDRREGARSTQPWGSPPVGGSFESDSHKIAMRRRAGGA